MKQPHVHAEVIKAYAAGETVEAKRGNSWVVEAHPLFYADVEYRVKPEPLVIVECIKMRDNGSLYGWQPHLPPPLGASKLLSQLTRLPSESCQ